MANWDTPASVMVEHLATRGHARVTLTGDAGRKLAKLDTEAEHFFSLDEASKRRHQSDDFNFGFRPFGRQYSITPDRLDLNESFTYRSDEPRLIPNHTSVGPYLDALSAYWEVVAALADALLEETARRLDAQASFDFEAASYIEINSYLRSTERALLQDRHEDGHLLTILTADAPGLEVEVEGQMTPVEFSQNELMIMPGSLLTDLTGGFVSPLFHQVRNRDCRSRRSILFLVDPSPASALAPFRVNETNRDVDLAHRALTNSRKFGLPNSPLV